MASPLIEQLRQEEMERYGLATNSNGAGIIGSASAGVGRGAGRTNAQNASGYGDGYGALGYGSGYEQDAAYNNTPYSKDNYGAFANNMASENNYAGANYNPESEKPPLPYVPEDEIDYSLDYGEYTFNSQDFNDYRENGPASVPLPRKNNSAPHDSVAPHDSLGALSSEDARSFEDAHVSPVGTAVNNTAEEMVGVGKDAASAGVAGAGVVGAGAAGVGAGAAGANVVSADVEPQFPAQAQAQPQTPAYPQTPSQASVQAPATMVFAAGGNAGQPQAQLSNSAVRAHLIDTTNNRTYSLACARLIIGRERSCDIKLPDINASRTHAEIRYEPQGVWSITDLGSTNGTSVNGRGVSSQTLYPGDTITIGMTNLVFELA